MSRGMTLAALVCGALFALVLASPASAEERDRFDPAVGCSGKNCWPSYSQGDVDTDVWSIQYFLLARGFTSVRATETYDTATTRAVSSFQRKSGLPQTGVVNGPTWQKLLIKVKFDKRSNAVRALQVQLNQQYGYNVPNTGYFGPETRRDVRDFQSKNGLPVTGKVDANTWRATIVTR